MRRAQVLVWSELLEANNWVDLQTNCRTEAGLIRRLRAGVRKGEWGGWRLITIHHEVIGNDEPIPEGKQ